ncbi:hypothetical protein N7495_009954 [Penicillium taxi]|uniref:uncharacterized protein n=1 Tax=Penicillium taxi TaxID=168475 RepID=UPI002545B98F|nr:uncharacterized protein N7495_009954 [Penicillium taxi]KAJ5885444.1 hypothetical protein N7495_009954 [Penicillium taxi]
MDSNLRYLSTDVVFNFATAKGGNDANVQYEGKNFSWKLAKPLSDKQMDRSSSFFQTDRASTGIDATDEVVEDDWIQI